MTIHRECRSRHVVVALQLGNPYRHTGKPQAAKEHLAAATTKYHGMDIGFWLRRVEMEMLG